MLRGRPPSPKRPSIRLVHVRAEHSPRSVGYDQDPTRPPRSENTRSTAPRPCSSSHASTKTIAPPQPLTWLHHMFTTPTPIVVLIFAMIASFVIAMSNCQMLWMRR